MKNSIYSPNNNPNDLEKLNRFGLRDKIDQGSGLSQNSPENASYTSVEHTLVLGQPRWQMLRHISHLTGEEALYMGMLYQLRYWERILQ